MERIGFSQYTSCLLKYGWDDLEFLSDLTEADLTEAGVPKQHQKMVTLHVPECIKQKCAVLSCSLLYRYLGQLFKGLIKLSNV